MKIVPPPADRMMESFRLVDFYVYNNDTLFCRSVIKKLKKTGAD